MFMEERSEAAQIQVYRHDWHMLVKTRGGTDSQQIWIPKTANALSAACLIICMRV